MNLPIVLVPGPNSSAAREPVRRFSVPRILVIEDDANIASLLVGNLNAEGYLAESAPSLSIAWRTCRPKTQLGPIVSTAFEQRALYA
jgi:hypothetical protein